MLSCKGICKSFKDIEVLKDVSLHVNKGEIVTLLGSSGCGKSTFLRVLAGLEKSQKGDIFIDKKRVAGNGVEIPPQKREVAFVFQDYALLPHLSVKENIIFGLKNISKSLQTKKVEMVSKLLGIESYLTRYPHELSGGQQQRVSIARAIGGSPKILLLDEPFSNLDTSLKKTLRYELKKVIKELEIGAIFVTHDQKEALSMSDRIALMRGGFIEQFSSPRDIYEAPISKYAASFMGDISYIMPSTLNLCDAKGSMTLGIRPQNVKFDFSRGDLKVNVEDVTYTGEYKILKTRLLISGEPLLVSVDSLAEINVGDVGYVNIDKSRVIWLNA